MIDEILIRIVVRCSNRFASSFHRSRKGFNWTKRSKKFVDFAFLSFRTILILERTDRIDSPRRLSKVSAVRLARESNGVVSANLFHGMEICSKRWQVVAKSSSGIGWAFSHWVKISNSCFSNQSSWSSSELINEANVRDEDFLRLIDRKLFFRVASRAKLSTNAFVLFLRFLLTINAPCWFNASPHFLLIFRFALMKFPSREFRLGEIRRCDRCVHRWKSSRETEMKSEVDEQTERGRATTSAALIRLSADGWKFPFDDAEEPFSRELICVRFDESDRRCSRSSTRNYSMFHKRTIESNRDEIRETRRTRRWLGFGSNCDWILFECSSRPLSNVVALTSANRCRSSRFVW